MRPSLGVILVLLALYVAWRYRESQQPAQPKTQQKSVSVQEKEPQEIPKKEPTIYGTVGTSGKISDPLYDTNQDKLPRRPHAPSSIANEF